MNVAIFPIKCHTTSVKKWRLLKHISPPPDKSVIMWKLTRDETNYGIPQRSLRGHSHFVSDVVISSDGQFALSGAWDGTLRLWDLTR